jgi:hypothetical protein
MASLNCHWLSSYATAAGVWCAGDVSLVGLRMIQALQSTPPASCYYNDYTFIINAKPLVTHRERISLGLSLCDASQATSLSAKTHQCNPSSQRSEKFPLRKFLQPDSEPVRPVAVQQAYTVCPAAANLVDTSRVALICSWRARSRSELNAKRQLPAGDEQALPARLQPPSQLQNRIARWHLPRHFIAFNA